MSCREGPDPADFEPGSIDPTDDPDNPVPELSILDATVVSINGDLFAQFPVVSTGSDPNNAMTVRWDTANGDATSGGGYYQPFTNQTLSIPAGSTEGTISVPILVSGSTVGNKHFFVNISNPTNATIIDTQGRADWDWEAPPPPPPPPDPIDAISFVAWAKPGVVHAQFADCAYKYACTGAASSAAMSALIKRETGQTVELDWKKFYRDNSGCTACCGSSPAGCGGCTSDSLSRMLARARDNGIKELNSATVHKLASFQKLTDTTKAGLIRKIKRGLVDNGIIAFGSPWYSDPNAGWNRCLSCNNFVLRDPDMDGPYGGNNTPCTQWGNADLTRHGGHAWVITGWNDNKAGGAFEIQSSHGRDWGSDGRCWLPYSYIGISAPWSYYKPVYGGTV